MDLMQNGRQKRTKFNYSRDFVELGGSLNRPTLAPHMIIYLSGLKAKDKKIMPIKQKIKSFALFPWSTVYIAIE